MGAGQRKAVTRPLALHQGDYPTGEKREEKRGKERKKERGRPGEDQRMKTTFLQLQTFHSVKRHFLIKAILAFYLKLWAIFTKSGSKVVFLSLFCVIISHACRPHVQYRRETDVPETQLWGSAIVLKTVYLSGLH